MTLALSHRTLAARAETEFDAGGSGSLRIEQEDKIAVPSDRVEEVWTFLNEHYVRETKTLAKLDPRFFARASEEDFADTYYDTPHLQLLAANGGVRHRKRLNVSNPADRKNNRELMQIKVSGISDNALSRGEYKFPVDVSMSSVSVDRDLPMVQFVKASHRQAFRDRLSLMGLDPDAMRPILTINDHRRRIYIEFDGRPFISLSLDQVTSALLWARASFVELEPEINEIVYTNADAAARKHMEEVNAIICGEIKARFPYLRSDLTPKYSKAFGQLEPQVPFLRTLLKVNAPLADTVMIAALVIIGAGVSVVVASHRLRRKLLSQRACPSMGAS